MWDAKSQKKELCRPFLPAISAVRWSILYPVDVQTLIVELYQKLNSLKFHLCLYSILVNNFKLSPHYWPNMPCLAPAAVLRDLVCSL